MGTNNLMLDTMERPAACQVHGEYTERGFSIMGRVIWSGCTTCRDIERAEEERKEREQAEREKQARIEAKLNVAGIPARFRDRTLENFVADTEEQREALATAKSFIESWPRHKKAGTSVVFSGNPGTGKSHLAIAILQHVLESGTGIYLNVLDLVRMVRDTWRRTGQSETEVLDMLGRLDLLVIDEVGVQYGTDGEQVVLFDVINRRYRDCKPTIMLTNLRAKEFEEFVGARTFDRLKEGGIWQRFAWDSYRGRK